MKSYYPFIIGLCSFFYLLACGKQEPPQPENQQAHLPTPSSKPTPAIPQKTPSASPKDLMVVEWDGGSITLSQVDKILGDRKADLIQRAAPNVNIQDLVAQQRKKVVITLLDNYLLIQEARARQLTLTPAQQEQLLRDIRSKYETKDDYLKQLDGIGREEDLLKIITNIKLARLCFEDQQQKIKDSINPQTMKEFYDQNLDEYFSTAGRSNINWVDIYETENRSLQEAEELTRKVYLEVKQKMGALETYKERRKVIQQCARDYSDDFSGDYNYGYRTVYQHDSYLEYDSKMFMDEVKKREEGELSDVVRTKKGYGFFLVKDKTPPYVHPLESEYTQKMLPNMMLRFKMEDWREDMRKKYNVRMVEENLSVLAKK